MAVYRNIQLGFWDDNKVVDDFTPEDKYFYLYLLTNPHTNLCGCYEVSLQTISNETGYNKDSVERLLERFENVHHVIKYSKQTKEVLILNWNKYNWTRSEKLDKPLFSQVSKVKNEDYKHFLLELINSRDTVSIPYPYPMDTTVTDTDIYINTITNIINYLNNKCNTNYKNNTKNTIKHITARLKEGYTEENFYTVIDFKSSQWLEDKKMRDYLRPDTLFGTKFESYLNSAPKPNLRKKEDLQPKTDSEEALISDEEFERMVKAGEL